MTRHKPHPPPCSRGRLQPSRMLSRPADLTALASDGTSDAGSLGARPGAPAFSEGKREISRAILSASSTVNFELGDAPQWTADDLYADRPLGNIEVSGGPAAVKRTFKRFSKTPLTSSVPRFRSRCSVIEVKVVLPSVSAIFARRSKPLKTAPS